MSENSKDKKVITISREFGSGGRLIGKRLAEKLGVPYYDSDTINDRISEESGFVKEMFAGEEKKAKNSFLYSLTSAMGTGESGPESLSLNERVFLAQFDAIRKIADEGPCVIVGRCADDILEEDADACHVFIFADEDDRIARIVRKRHLEEEEAYKLIKKQDKIRRSYYQFYTDRKWGTREGKDLLINTSATGIDGAVAIIVQFLKSKGYIE